MGCLEADFYDRVELGGDRGGFALSPQDDGQVQHNSPRTERPANHIVWQTQRGAIRLPPRDFCAAALAAPALLRDSAWVPRPDRRISLTRFRSVVKKSPASLAACGRLKTGGRVPSAPPRCRRGGRPRFAAPRQVSQTTISGKPTFCPLTEGTKVRELR